MRQTSGFGRSLVLGRSLTEGEGYGSVMRTVEPRDANRLAHNLIFASLFDPGRALAFPCDHSGEVARWPR